jgi:hypothetical protein
MTKYEDCRYCDTGFPFKTSDETVCGGCGAEWEAAKILVELEVEVEQIED